MKITYGGTIPVAQYGNIQVQFEVDVVEEYDSYNSAINHLRSLFKDEWNKYSDRMMVRDVTKTTVSTPKQNLASQPQLDFIMSRAETAHMAKLITDEEYEELKTNAHTYTTVRASSVIDQLKNKIDQANRDARAKQKKDNEIIIDQVPF